MADNDSVSASEVRPTDL